MLHDKKLFETARSHCELGVDVGRSALQAIHVPTNALTEARFCDWISDSMVGQAIEYHQGFLLVDRSESNSALPTKERTRLHAVARRAWIACELGLVHLLSLKLDEGRYRYLAVRTRSQIPVSQIRARLGKAESSAAAPATATPQ